MSRWWRAYDDALNDPKVQRMPPYLFKTWFNILCVASKHDGILPPMAELAYLLRRRVEDVSRDVADLLARGLLDDENKTVRPHNWDGRQYKSDLSTQRVRDHRKRSRNVAHSVTETPPDTESDTESEKIEEDTPSAIIPFKGKYAFEGITIRLSKKDFDEWTRDFQDIRLGAELRALDSWAAQFGKNWYHPVKSALAKRNREAFSAAQARRERAARPADDAYVEKRI